MEKKQAKYLQALGFPLGDNLVFCNERNKMFQLVKHQLWLKYVIDNYDLKKVTVHAFSHTYATLSHDAGANPIAVKEQQLSHSSLKTTFDVYTATTCKEPNEATKKLAAYLKF